ncbi:MAG: hypothetical protein A4E65_02268 [Syntrophorhabdus sp. PtaU1.Bin153]|nr:MAG: hypothetical protein A4E65_02268 [Syntrophorhabdus sp. PtaU1.Bin153]
MQTLIIGKPDSFQLIKAEENVLKVDERDAPWFEIKGIWLASYTPDFFWP